MNKKQAKIIGKLWQAATDYEQEQISGSALSLLTKLVIENNAKAIAVQEWINGIWSEYYTLKAEVMEGNGIDVDFSSHGTMPHSVPELMAEAGF